MRSRLHPAAHAALAGVAALLPLSACHDDDDGHDNGNGGIPVFREQEDNDDPLTANHFGVLHQGEQFIIEGFVRDDLADPFDGFAFTAGSALHVDFELFIDNALADLDVCLYDPQIDQTVACFATEVNPEVGGVDVFAGGLDFHLVVESFAGDATYSLVITVLPLLREPMRAADAPGIAASDARERARGRGPDGVSQGRARALFLLEQVFEFDEARGIVIERRKLLTR